MRRTPDHHAAQRRAWQWLGALLGAAAVIVPAVSHGGEPAATLQPYTARYQVSFRGLNGGQIEMSLARGTQNAQWLYETRAYPSLLGRIAVSPNARERSVMQVAATGIRPLTFNFDDGSSSAAQDVRLKFDWTAGMVRGDAEGVPFELPVKPGTQDTASVQVAMLIELLAGRSPKGFPILTGRKLREYRYWPEGEATVTTPFGKFDTVVWANQRDGSTRVTKVWHAPALGYMPVQAIQYRKGQAETHMKLLALTREP